jgi:hypothetical protein
LSTEVTEAEQRLTERWIRPALGPDVHVRVGRIDDAPPSDGTTVTLTLIDIAPAPLPPGPVGPPPLQVRARYLVTVVAAQADAERQALAELAFAASPVTELELEKAPGPEVWLSLGVATRPALVASVLWQRERRARAIRRVRQLVAKWSSSRPLLGVVVGPGDVPIAGALVEVEGLPQTAYSNHRGEFAFRGVPGDDAPPTLVVSAKGATVRVRVDGDATATAPFLIRIPLSES